MKNILDLEMDELTADIAKGINILSEALNSFSSQSFFFIDPALLGFFGKSVKML
jgi:hypothetical protein